MNPQAKAILAGFQKKDGNDVSFSSSLTVYNKNEMNE